jgi:hypothetical protein
MYGHPMMTRSSTKAHLQADARLIHDAATRIQAEWRRYEEWPLRNRHRLAEWCWECNKWCCSCNDPAAETESDDSDSNAETDSDEYEEWRRGWLRRCCSCNDPAAETESDDSDDSEMDSNAETDSDDSEMDNDDPDADMTQGSGAE